MLFMRIFIILLHIVLVTSIPVPNGQLGNVEVECGEDTIEAVFLTEAPFQGRIFVIGHAQDPNCVSRDVGKRTTSITINKTECGVVTTRSSEPNGLFSTVKIMISFHTDFVTKVDKGYEISCFYMVAEKTVTYPLTVAAEEVAPVNELAEMPRCRYEVLDVKTAQPASIVTVGTPLLHRWICDSAIPERWCMTVHTCEVEDGSGTHFRILDDTGCSVDRYLLSNLEYPGNLLSQVEAHAFKFADKVVTKFQCSIRLDIKDGECPIPECPDLTKSQQTRHGRSAKIIELTNFENKKPENIRSFEVNVKAPQLDIIDARTDFGYASNDDVVLSLKTINEEVCFSRTFYLTVATLTTSLILTLTTIIIIILKIKQKN